MYVASSGSKQTHVDIRVERARSFAERCRCWLHFLWCEERATPASARTLTGSRPVECARGFGRSAGWYMYGIPRMGGAWQIGKGQERTRFDTGGRLHQVTPRGRCGRAVAAVSPTKSVRDRLGRVHQNHISLSFAGTLYVYMYRSR